MGAHSQFTLRRKKRDTEDNPSLPAQITSALPSVYKYDIEDSEDGVDISEILWERAYSTVKHRDPELVAIFEKHFNSTDDSPEDLESTQLNPKSIENIIQSRLQKREASQWLVHLRQKPVKIREQGENIIRFILWSDGIISTAVSAQPYLALAWSGVSMVLPLLLNSSQQNEAMMQGLNEVSELIPMYHFRQQVHVEDRNGKGVQAFLEAVEQLYADIFEYQAMVLRQISHGSARRAFRGVMKLDDWKSKLQEIKKSDEICVSFTTSLNESNTKMFYRQQLWNSDEALRAQRQILDFCQTSQIQRQEDRRDDMKAKVLQCLSSDYKTDKDFVSSRVKGTCEWFLQDEQFLQWRHNPDPQILWVSAGPGCGKSVLSRALVDERRVCKSISTSTVCYFFFKDGQEQRSNGANALCALLHQIFENTKLISHALPSYKRHGDNLRNMFSELWQILIECSKDPDAGEIVCVIDALDECMEDARSQLLANLLDLHSRKETRDDSPSRIKFLVTSRAYIDLEDGFDDLAETDVCIRCDGDEHAHEIGKEINLVIDNR